MDQDITLHINSHVLEEATQYAHTKGIDLSSLVETLLRKLTKGKTVRRIRPLHQLDPRVQQLVGVVHLPADEVGLDGEVSKDLYLEKE